MPTKTLYHGTTAEILLRLQQEGILPRSQSKGKSNWKHTVPSNPKAVYLTTAYAWHFAAVASEEGIGLILEIDRDQLLPWHLCPDEDFMEQGSRKVDPTQENPHLAPIDWDMKRRTMFYRKIAQFNPDLADESLRHMGTAAYYGRIPWKAVTRYVIINWQKLDFRLRLQAVDSMVSIMNYKILAPRHEAFTKWFFGDPVEAAEVNGNKQWIASAGPDLTEHFQQQDAATAEAMKNRSGLTVTTLQLVKACEPV